MAKRGWHASLRVAVGLSCLLALLGCGRDEADNPTFSRDSGSDAKAGSDSGTSGSGGTGLEGSGGSGGSAGSATGGSAGTGSTTGSGGSDGGTDIDAGTDADPGGGYPTAATTGVPAGVTLSPCNGNLSTAGATYDRCLFSSGVEVQANNVTIKRSKVIGVVTGNYGNQNLTMTDVEIDGDNTTLDATNGLCDYTCLRCKVHDAAKCFTGRGFTVEDSYCYDIYGTSGSHNEPVLGSGTDQITLRHNNFVANWSAASQGGGMSAVIALYSHGSFWGALDNVLMENNRLESAGDAWYCVYGGNSPDYDPSNVDFIGNVFIGGPDGGCRNPFVGWYRSATNTWSNNRYDTGQNIPEPPTHDY